MNKRIFLTTITGLLLLGILAAIGILFLGKKAPERPYIVGPELYQIHTDAKFFRTRIIVNGVELELSNADGNGSSQTSDYRVSGATGYPNTMYLNGYLSPGDNEVKVIFESPLLEQVRGTEGETAFIRDMYAHVVINTGELTRGTLGVDSYVLDQLMDSPELDIDVAILKDVLFRRLTSEIVNNEVSVTHTINIAANKSVQVEADECSFELKSFSGYTGQVSINGTAFLNIKGNGSATILDSIDDLILPGDNAFEINATAIEEGRDITSELRMECDLDIATKEIGFPKKYKYYDFGSFFNNMYIPVATIEFDKPGIFSTTFYYSE